MLLAIDVGNTRIKAGMWDGRTWTRLELAPSRPEGVRALADRELARGAAAAICATVVPMLRKEVTECFPGMEISFPEGNSPWLEEYVDYESRTTLGADRLANGMALLNLTVGRKAAVSVDLGTATKFDVVTFSEEGGARFRGGAIMPGLHMGARSLHLDTAQLPDIPLTVPLSVIGKDTTSCLQSGILYGHAGAIDGILDRIQEEAGEIQVFATGGFSDLIVPLCRTSMKVVPTLTLDGLVAIARRLGLWQPPA